MRDPDRIARIIHLVAAVWEQHPDLRLGQMIGNAAKAADYPSEDAFFLEDERLEIGLRILLAGPKTFAKTVPAPALEKDPDES